MKPEYVNRPDLVEDSESAVCQRCQTRFWGTEYADGDYNVLCPECFEVLLTQPEPHTDAPWYVPVWDKYFPFPKGHVLNRMSYEDAVKAAKESAVREGGKAYILAPIAVIDLAPVIRRVGESDEAGEG